MSVCLYVIYILQNGLTDLAQILGGGEGQKSLKYFWNITKYKVTNISFTVKMIGEGWTWVPLQTPIMTKLIETSGEGATFFS